MEKHPNQLSDRATLGHDVISLERSRLAARLCSQSLIPPPPARYFLGWRDLSLHRALSQLLLPHGRCFESGFLHQRPELPLRSTPVPNSPFSATRPSLVQTPYQKI